MLALLLVAVSVGLSNFAAAVSLGVAGVDARMRLRVGLVFGAFEAGMPVVGLLIGDHVAAQLGEAGRWAGGALLIGVGLYGVAGPACARLVSSRLVSTRLVSSRPVSSRPVSSRPVSSRPGYGGSNLRLLLSGLALSLDNLVVGFALGTYQVGILLGAVIIGAVSVGLSLIGLELGGRLGGWAGRWADQVGGIILVAVGVAVAAGALR